MGCGLGIQEPVTMKIKVEREQSAHENENEISHHSISIQDDSEYETDIKPKSIESRVQKKKNKTSNMKDPAQTMAIKSEPGEKQQFVINQSHSKLSKKQRMMINHSNTRGLGGQILLLQPQPRMPSPLSGTLQDTCVFLDSTCTTTSVANVHTVLPEVPAARFCCSICKAYFPSASVCIIHMQMIHKNSAGKTKRLSTLCYELLRKNANKNSKVLHGHTIREIMQIGNKMRLKGMKCWSYSGTKRKRPTGDKRNICYRTSSIIGGNDRNIQEYAPKTLATLSKDFLFNASRENNCVLQGNSWQDIFKQISKEKWKGLNLKSKLRYMVGNATKEQLLSDNDVIQEIKSAHRRGDDTSVEESLVAVRRQADDADLEEFLKATDKVTKYAACPICGKVLKDRHGVTVHMRIHTGEKPFKCEVCGNQFTTASTRTCHMRIHRNEKPFSCSVCGYSCRTSSALKEHSFQHSDTKRYYCSRCGLGFTKKAYLTNHEKLHEESATNGKHMYLHKKVGKKNDVRVKWRVICNICNKGFMAESALNEHNIQKHTNIKRFECDICHKMFRSTAYLKIHRKIHLGDRPRECPFCQRAFLHSQSLRIHISLRHTDERPHSCTICGFQFAQVTNLKTHMKIHSADEKPGSQLEEGRRRQQVRSRYYQSLEDGTLKPKTRKTDRRAVSDSSKTDGTQIKKQKRQAKQIYSDDQDPTHYPYGCALCKYRSQRKVNLTNHMLRMHPYQISPQEVHKQIATRFGKKFSRVKTPNSRTSKRKSSGAKKSGSEGNYNVAEVTHCRRSKRTRNQAKYAENSDDEFKEIECETVSPRSTRHSNKGRTDVDDIDGEYLREIKLEIKQEELENVNTLETEVSDLLTPEDDDHAQNSANLRSSGEMVANECEIKQETDQSDDDYWNGENHDMLLRIKSENLAHENNTGLTEPVKMLHQSEDINCLQTSDNANATTNRSVNPGCSVHKLYDKETLAKSTAAFIMYHEGPPYTCSICRIKFNVISHFKTHLIAHIHSGRIPIITSTECPPHPVQESP